MLTISCQQPVTGMWAAFHGMRNAHASWIHSDSIQKDTWGLDDPANGFVLGPNDLECARKLMVSAPERKFLRMIHVQADITAPLYWWKQFDTYKVGTVSNSTSTMHSLHKNPVSIMDCSTEHLDEDDLETLRATIDRVNEHRDRMHIFLAAKNNAAAKEEWYKMIQLLPDAYNQTRTVDFTYENVAAMLRWRSTHRLDEWRKFTKWLHSLPYVDDLFGQVKE